MPRHARQTPGGYVCHALNRATVRLILFRKPADYDAFLRVVDAALATRDVLRDHELESFVKTTGGKGLHVVVPVSPRRHTWQEAKRFCKHIAGLLWQGEQQIHRIGRREHQGRDFHRGQSRG